MNDNQIVLSLLNFYKNEGIDLHQILDDPIFVKLSTPTKIEMIKRHAKEIHDGTVSGVTRGDLKRAGWSALWHGLMGAMTGAAASAATAKLIPGGRISPAAILLGAAPGIGFGLGLSALQSAGTVMNRMDMKKRLADAVEDPTGEAAVGVLAKRNLQRTHQDSVAFNKFLDRIENNTDERSKNNAIEWTTRANNEAGRFIPSN